jgi:hypothetical protein
MWRYDNKFGAYSNYLELYQYWRGMSDQYGDRFYLNGVGTGYFVTVKTIVNLGSDTSDGRVRVFLNGSLKLDRNFRFLGGGQSWKLNRWVHSTFYGGNDGNWAPTVGTSLMLDNMRVANYEF